MRTTLISLHGFTMNGDGLRQMLAELEARLAEELDFVYPDAPHLASAASVAGMASAMGGFRAKPPNRQWWNASDDHRVYAGWDATREALRAEALRHPSVGLLGFSQGAAVAAALAALSDQGAFPPLRFVVLVAGFLPRADDLKPLFATPIEVPSLHVLGDKDSFAKHGPQLLERFGASTRELLRWPGRHTVPTKGAAGDALVDFIRQRSR